MTLENKITKGNWRIHPFIKEFHRLKDGFDHFCWCWISREANREADGLAKLAKERLCPQDFTIGPPTSIVSVLRNEGHPGPPRT